MNCHQVKESMPLYYYGELAAEQEEEVEAHCAECKPCGVEVSDYRRFSSALDQAEIEPSASLLSECRELLARQVTEFRHPAPARSWWAQLFASHLDFRVPVGAVALVAVGWFSAKLVPMVNGTNQASLTSLVRSVEPDSQGRIRIAVDDVHRRIVSGGADDRQIRELLLVAAREESSPGVRVESVDLLKNMASSADVRAALLNAMERDPSPAVRLKALEGLKQFSQDRSVRVALTGVLLNDSSPGVRLQVIDLLVQHRDDAMVGVMQNLVTRENDSYVRGRLQRALLAMNASPGTF